MRRISPLSVVACLLALAGFARLADAQTSGAAKVMSMAGQVSVMRDSATWALSAGDSIQPQQIVITGSDGYAVFQVADGSTFDVYPNSRVVFRSNRGDWKDLLEILLGKVKVQIQHFGDQPNHNKVRTPTAVIAVRGTVFDVNVEDADATTLVVVEEGLVDVMHLLQGGKTVQLKQGEWIRVFKNQPLTARNIDHGAVMQKVMRAASDALNEILLHRPGSGTSAPSSGSGGPNGDKTGTPTPTGGGGGPPPPPH